jgi:hypothetical protein
MIPQEAVKPAMHRVLVFALLWAASAHAEAPAYLWSRTAAKSETIADRIAPPAGATRSATEGFGAWLRSLPLLPAGTAVHYFDGRIKPRQDVHEAIVDIDVGTRDLQQCADAVMRLRAEYLLASGKRIAFHPDPGKPREIAWAGGDRKAFAKFLVRVFADAGTASLAAELPKLPKGAPEPGDVLIQGGYPGHAVIVLDAADAKDGRRLLLLGQSYMPAQQIHVLKNLRDPSLSPWFDAAALDSPDGLETPEWRPFKRSDIRRFAR